MIEWWMLRATSTSASGRSSASIRSTIQFEPLEPWTENIVRSAPWAAAAKRSASAKIAGVVDERAEEAGRDRHVGGVEVLDALLVLEDRRRAPAVVAADVLVEDADDRRRGGRRPRGHSARVAIIAPMAAVRRPAARGACARRSRSIVNGVRQQPGADYEVDGRELVFARALRKDRISGWRWFARRLGRRDLPPGRLGRRALRARRRHAGRRREARRSSCCRERRRPLPRPQELQRAEDRARRRASGSACRSGCPGAPPAQQLGALQRRVGDAEVGDRLRLVGARARARARRPAGIAAPHSAVIRLICVDVR